jgi:hypothetical protein
MNLKRIPIAPCLTVVAIAFFVIVPTYLQLQENEAFDIQGTSPARIESLAKMVTEFPELKSMVRIALSGDNEVSNREYLEIRVKYSTLARVKANEAAQAKLRSVL